MLEKPPYREIECVIEKEEFPLLKNLFYGPGAKWTYTGHSNFGDKARFWYFNLDLDFFFAVTCVNRLRKSIPDLGMLRTVYANGQTCLQKGNWHTDGPGGTTVLLYLNDMLPEDGGETLFKTESGKEFFFLPRESAMIAFPGNVVHRSAAPDANYPSLRVTVAWKFS